MNSRARCRTSPAPSEHSSGYRPTSTAPTAAQWAALSLIRLAKEIHSSPKAPTSLPTSRMFSAGTCSQKQLTTSRSQRETKLQLAHGGPSCHIPSLKIPLLISKRSTRGFLKGHGAPTTKPQGWRGWDAWDGGLHRTDSKGRQCRSVRHSSCLLQIPELHAAPLGDERGHPCIALRGLAIQLL